MQVGVGGEVRDAERALALLRFERGKKVRAETGESIRIPRYDIVPIPEGMRGNLAPEGAVIKAAGTDRKSQTGPARVYDTEEIVVKPMSTMLRHINMFSGNTILGDGSVIMILDPNGLARATGIGAGGETRAQQTSARELLDSEEVRKAYLGM